MGNNCVSGKITDHEDGFLSAFCPSYYFYNSSSSSDHDIESIDHIIITTPPQLMKIIKKKEDTIISEPPTPAMITESSRVVVPKSDQVLVIAVRENPKPIIKEPKKPNRLMSVGLQVDSILGTKTGHFKENYNLGHEIGRGQYGKTFLCADKKGVGKNYACKSIAKRRLLTEDDVDDVRREIEIMHHLSGRHPNVVSIKGAYEDPVAVHVVMELCKGGELFDRIVKRGYYSEIKAAELTRTIVGVIETCHSLGVMHRDLKPENFLFVDEEEDSDMMTIDFGLSVFFKPGEILSDVVGSPYYVAPEVLCEHYGPEADVWSAGVIVYLLLCGVLPFWGESEEEIFEEVLHGDVDLSSDPWPNISESAKDLVKKMLVRDPKRRITTHQVLCHPWVQLAG